MALSSRSRRRNNTIYSMEEALAFFCGDSNMDILSDLPEDSLTDELSYKGSS